LSLQIKEGLKAYDSDDFWKLKGRGSRSYRWSHKTLVMGVLNITPDSFSDGGRYLDTSMAVEQALRMQEEGADWIDLGGESSRPGAKAVSAKEEKKRVLPVMRACTKVLRVPLSVDTYKAEVAQAAVMEGAQLVNDIGALALDPRMGKVLSRLKVPVILMHMRGKPRTMQKKPVYRDVVGEILSFFRERMDYARQCGIAEERILLDPGFGFGKTPWHNIELIRRLWEFKVLGRPLVLGPSRKSTLGLLLGGVPPEKRVEATGAAVTAAILKGADWVRVHDVQSMVPVVKIADAIRYDRGLAAP
jgi:dihydropteroate synthase